MVGRGACLYPDQAGRNPGEECQKLTPSYLTTNDNPTRRVDAMNLKNVLRDIQTDRANLVHGWLLSCGSSTNRLLAHRDAGGGAIHSIIS
jgi:hypothetical protein